MKNFNILLLLIPFLFLSCKDDDKDEDDFVDEETPDDIVPSVIKEEVLNEIENMFPEYENFRAGHPEVFEASAEKNIVLSKESKVFLTFVSEGAGFQNSLGYYTYTVGNEPTDTASLNVQILFPHVSNEILHQGDILQLGNESFPAGTVVGFFLIVKGWAGKVNYNNEIHYTNYELNEEGQQHVLFKLADFDEIILSFEDKVISENSDQDFNDIIFTVSDNVEQGKTEGFNLNNVVEY